MKRIFLFLGRNTVPTVVVSIITLVVFTTSIYGFVKVASSNSPIKDIPEVETVSQKEAEIVSPTLAPKLEENNENINVNSTEPYVEPSEPPITLSPSISPTGVNQQNYSVQNNWHKQSTQTEVRKKDDSKIEADDDVDDEDEYNDRERSEYNNQEHSGDDNE